MYQPIRHSRRAGRVFLAAFAALSLAACEGSDDILPPPQHRAAALQVISRNPQPGVAGQPLPEKLRVRVVDEAGNGVQGVNVAFYVSEGGGTIFPGGENTDADGYVEVMWRLGPSGPQTASASVVSLGGVPLNARIVEVPAAVAPILGALGDHISSAAERMVQGLPNNPRAAPFMEAKIALLRTPGLGGDIVDTHRYSLSSVVSRSGATLPVAAVFPVEAMRGEAEETMDVAGGALPLLESWLGLSYPAPYVRIWYGFSVGSAGGGGYVLAEDRTTYRQRELAQGLLLSHEPMVIHEMTHTWMSHEGLNQFLELYGWNVLATGSTDVGAWTWTRAWEPGKETNQGIHALLDIYQLVGPEAMAAGYRAIIPLNLPYGQPMTAQARQSFAAAVPEALRPQVAAKLEKVTY